MQSGQSYAILDSRFARISGGVAIVTAGAGGADARPLFLENATADSSVEFLVDHVLPGPSLTGKAFWQGLAFIGGTNHRGHGTVGARWVNLILT